MIRVGTSGWQYDDWRGVLYPPGLPKDRWLETFARRFATVEVNNSFYRLPSEETFARWRTGTPEGFLMAVKASRFITHVRRLRDCRDPVRLLWSRARRLGSRLGPVLFQLPPGFRADLGRLEALLDALPGGMKAAFEFRDRSWWTDDVLGMLDVRGCAVVLADRPGARVATAVTGGWAYLRFHQGTERGPGYRREKLRRWAGRITGLDADDVFVYFNNDTGGAAVRDAETLRELLRERGAAVS
ncbi:MAG TPA: DUF72 domain-containing protein [Actinomycetota bacterium]|nr:DUF72 domain-containing protein [Actinomycetota bacterium]